MKPSDIRTLIGEIRARPGSTLSVLAVAAGLAVASFWASGYFSTLGRQHAAAPPAPVDIKKQPDGRVRPLENSLVLYATEPGRLALDGSGPVSPFVAAVTRALDAGVTDVDFLARRVREEVHDATAGQQVPHYESKLRVSANLADKGYTRVAVLVGMGAYDHLAPLENPAHDVDALDATLRDLGFVTVTAIDKGRDALLDQLARVQGLVEGAGDDILLLTYFSGHGAQIDGTLYLLPRDAIVSVRADVAAGGLALEDLYAVSGHAHVAASVLLIDVARVDPF